MASRVDAEVKPSGLWPTLVGDSKITRNALFAYFLTGIAIIGLAAPVALTKASPLAEVWGIRWVWTILHPFGELLASVATSPLFDGFNGIAATLAIWVVPLFLAASIVRALLAWSPEPVGSAVVPILAGMVALPAFAWVLFILGWIVRIGVMITFWLIRTAGNFATYVQMHPWILITALILAVIGVVAALVATREIGCVLVLIGGIIAFAVLVFLAGAVSNWMSNHLDLAQLMESLTQIALNIVSLTATLAILVAVVAYLGQSFLQPWGQSWKSASSSSAHSDIAAGIGVSLAVIFLACNLNPVFKDWFTGHLDGSPFEVLWAPVVSSPEWILPGGTIDFLAPCVAVFTGFPEFVVIAGAGSIAIVGLLNPGIKRVKDSWGPLMKASILRALVALVIILAAGWLLSKAQGD